MLYRSCTQYTRYTITTYNSTSCDGKLSFSFWHMFCTVNRLCRHITKWPKQCRTISLIPLWWILQWHFHLLRPVSSDSVGMSSWDTVTWFAPIILPHTFLCDVVNFCLHWHTAFNKMHDVIIIMFHKGIWQENFSAKDSALIKVPIQPMLSRAHPFSRHLLGSNIGRW